MKEFFFTTIWCGIYSQFNFLRAFSKKLMSLEKYIYYVYLSKYIWNVKILVILHSKRQVSFNIFWYYKVCVVYIVIIYIYERVIKVCLLYNIQATVKFMYKEYYFQTWKFIFFFGGKYFLSSKFCCIFYLFNYFVEIIQFCFESFN